MMKEQESKQFYLDGGTTDTVFVSYAAIPFVFLTSSAT